MVLSIHIPQILQIKTSHNLRPLAMTGMLLMGCEGCTSSNPCTARDHAGMEH